MKTHDTTFHASRSLPMPGTVHFNPEQTFPRDRPVTERHPAWRLIKLDVTDTAMYGLNVFDADNTLHVFGRSIRPPELFSMASNSHAE